MCFFHRKRMFIWNNIFFSYAFDSRDHFQGVGGRMSLVLFYFRLWIIWDMKSRSWNWIYINKLRKYFPFLKWCIVFLSGDEAAYVAAVSSQLFVLNNNLMLEWADNCSEELSKEAYYAVISLSIQGGDLRGVMAYNRLDTPVCWLS